MHNSKYIGGITHRFKVLAAQKVVYDLMNSPFYHGVGGSFRKAESQAINHIWLWLLNLCPTLLQSHQALLSKAFSQARILEWVAIFFSKGSSPPRDQTHISCIAGRFFTSESPGKPQSTSIESESAFFFECCLFYIYVCVCVCVYLYSKIYLFIWLYQLLGACEPLVVACGILVPWSGIEPGPSALGAQSLSHWTTRNCILTKSPGWCLCTKQLEKHCYK